MSYKKGFTARIATTYDKNIGDLGAANQFNDIDLSSIVPAGAKAILIRGDMTSSTAREGAIFKQANQNGYALLAQCVVASQKLDFQGFVPCNSGRVISVYRDPTTVTGLSFAVIGWII